MGLSVREPQPRKQEVKCEAIVVLNFKGKEVIQVKVSSVQFSRLVVSDPLRPRESKLLIYSTLLVLIHNLYHKQVFNKENWDNF